MHLHNSTSTKTEPIFEDILGLGLDAPQVEEEDMLGSEVEDMLGLGSEAPSPLNLTRIRSK